jgi:hypothetical protein
MTSAAEKKPAVLNGKAHDVVSEQVRHLSVAAFAVMGLADHAKVFSVQPRDLSAVYDQIDDALRALRELLDDDEE